VELPVLLEVCIAEEDGSGYCDSANEDCECLFQFLEATGGFGMWPVIREWCKTSLVDRGLRADPRADKLRCDAETPVSILFPLDVRLSTWLMFVAFVALAVRRRNSRPLIACWIWLITFEAVYDITQIAMGRYRPDEYLPIVLGVFTFAWFSRQGFLPDARFAFAAALVWMIWVVTGFHVNVYTMVDVNPSAEVLNEVAKSIWGLAYLMPLLSSDSMTRGGDADSVMPDAPRLPS
jgi:hypothetical protein